VITENGTQRIYTLFLKFSNTDAALPVQLIRMRPSAREGLAIPNLARTFAPAPSPSPITYFTCRKSSTITRSSPSVCNVGNWKLMRNQKVKYLWLSRYRCSSYFFSLNTFRTYSQFIRLPLQAGKYTKYDTGYYHISNTALNIEFHKSFYQHNILWDQRCRYLKIHHHMIYQQQRYLIKSTAYEIPELQVL
jgi:hypothetical protein